MERDWLLITVSTPPGGTSTLRVYAWRKLRSLGAHYLQQSVCLLPATPKTTRAVARLVTRLREEGGHGEMLRVGLSDSKQEAGVIDAIQRERTDEYRELVESTRQFHAELRLERRRGRACYTELEESDADLARYQRWLAAMRARDGLAGCYGKVDYPARVQEAVARIRGARPDAVTLNEACSRDVALIARRTGYHRRFSKVIYYGKPLPCVRPGGRGLFGDAVLTRAAIRSTDSQAFEAQAGPERRQWLCVSTRVGVDV
jgi:hypothetical protein